MQFLNLKKKKKKCLATGGLVGQTTITVAAVGSKAGINMQHLPPLQLILLVSGVSTMEKPSPSSLKASAFHCHALERPTLLQLPVHDYHWTWNNQDQMSLSVYIFFGLLVNWHEVPKMTQRLLLPFGFSGTLTVTPGRHISQPRN